MVFPKVLIVLVNYNSSSDTIECLRSLQNSTLKPTVVLVDNGSKDASDLRTSIMTNYPDTVLIMNEVNVGFGRANNIGIKWALQNSDAEFILLLNNDTTIFTDTLFTLLKGFTLDAKVGMTTCRIHYSRMPNLVWYGGGDINKNSGKIRIKDFRREATDFGAKKSRFVSFASGCVMMFKRTVLEELEGFDERFFMYVEDVELCLRMQKIGYKIWYDSTCVVLHRVHGSTSDSNHNLPGLHPRNKNLNFFLYNFTKNHLLTMYLYLSGWRWYWFLLTYLLSMAMKNVQYLFIGRIDANKIFLKAVKDFNYERKNSQIKIQDL